MMILIADDSATARLFIRKCLEIAGIAEATYVEVASGEEAWEILSSKPVDLLVTDLTMPGMGGVRLLKLVAGLPRRIPVLVVSAAGRALSEREAGELGVRAVLPKPVAPARVAAVLPQLGLVASPAGWALP